MRCVLLLLAISFTLRADQLNPETLKEFEAYMKVADSDFLKRGQNGVPFLWTDAAPARLSKVRGGAVEVSPWNTKSTRDVTDGLIHDWIAATFVPGATAQRAVVLLTDFSRHASFYAPEVMASRLISRQGDEYRSYLRLMKKKVITVVLDTEYSTRYVPAGPGRVRGIVRSTKIAEVEDAGQAGERLKPVDTGYGFLWRLNSYWTIEERDGGVYLELRSISLTRGIPFGLGTVIKPMVTALPRESLVATLEKTKRALLASPK